MRKLVFLLLALSVGAAFAQTAQKESLSGQPIEITSTGGTNYDNGVATARGNVAIHVGDTDIYADQATYNSETHDRAGEGQRAHLPRDRRTARATLVGDEGTYNTETKEIGAENLHTTNYPYLIGGERDHDHRRQRETHPARRLHHARFVEAGFHPAGPAHPGLRRRSGDHARRHLLRRKVPIF